jgi:hypothetical protein
MTVETTTWRAGGKFIRVLFTPQALLIYIEGYGVKGMSQGAPVCINLVGHPTVLVWGNIKQENPTHLISLIYAKEEL